MFPIVHRTEIMCYQKGKRSQTVCVDVQISTFHGVTQNRGGVTECDSSDNGQVGPHDDDDDDPCSADTPTPYRQSCRVREESSVSQQRWNLEKISSLHPKMFYGSNHGKFISSGLQLGKKETWICRDENVGRLVQHFIRSALKYLNSYWMDCYEILYRHSWVQEDDS